MNFFSLSEVAKMVNLSKTQIYRYCKRGFLSYVKQPAKGCIIEILIPETELEKLKHRPQRGRPFKIKADESKHSESI